MKPPGTETSPAKTRSRISIILGIVLLFITALFWAVDDAIVYVTGGMAAFFLFLGYYQHRQQRAAGWKASGNGGFRRGPSAAPPDRDIYAREPLTMATWLREALGSLGRPRGNTSGQIRTTRVWLAFVVVGLFAAIFFSIVSGSSNNNATAYLILGQMQWNNGQPDSARQNFSRAYRVDPGNTEAMVWYGKALMTLNNNDSASLLFDLALEAEPNNEEAIYNKAFLLYKYGSYENGRTLLEPVVTDCTDCMDPLLLMGDLYYVEKHYEESFPWYEKAYGEGARGSLLCQRLGYLYDVKQDYEKAVALYEEALVYDDTVTEIYQRLGELLPGEEGNHYRARAQGAN